MGKTPKYFKTLHHGELLKIFPDCYSVKGTMKLFRVFQYSRNMTVLVNNKSLILLNPIRLNFESEKKLLELGSIDHILKIEQRRLVAF